MLRLSDVKWWCDQAYAKNIIKGGLRNIKKSYFAYYSNISQTNMTPSSIKSTNSDKNSFFASAQRSTEINSSQTQTKAPNLEEAARHAQYIALDKEINDFADILSNYNYLKSIRRLAFGYKILVNFHI